MNADSLERHFGRIGARARLVGEGAPQQEPVTLDVRRLANEEVFEIVGSPRRLREVEVLDVQPTRRHLLLMTRDGRGGTHRFLCGHDERHWFVAAIPQTRNVTNVARAMEALKPPAVLEAQARFRLRRKERSRRRNPAYVRQGEWFFLPVPELHVDPQLVLCREPLSRGRGSKPHVAEECYRRGGELVYVSRLHPEGVDQETYQRLMRTEATRARRATWTVQRRNPEVHVRGRVRHPDHRTIRLRIWHRVEMNTEHKAAAMAQVVFLD